MMTNPEPVRVEPDALKMLRQYCLDKHGKLYGMVMKEASEAIREHVKRGY